MTATVDLSIVLPCRNQADHIGDVLRAYAGPLAATHRAYEIVIVPNACTDSTVEVVRALAADDEHMRVVENPAGGWGRSVLTGLAASRGQVLCYTNSARTDPADVARLLDLYDRHAPCVAKVRRVERGVPLREIGSWLYNLEAGLLFGITAGDVNGTPKMLPRALYDRLDLSSPGDLLDVELVAKASALGVPVVEMPVSGFRRHGGKSTTGLGSAWRMYSGALGLRRAVRAFTRRRA
jgi:glycosyltransferase involved in cell wall biosynthesis